MSNLTPELNLVQGVDDDDTADYLTIGLADSLSIIDGLFSASTGHNHNGSHQGGALEFLDLVVGEDLTVVGQSTLQGPVVAQANLNVAGTGTLNSLDVTLTSRLRGAVTMDAGLTITGTINSTGTLTVGQDLSVGRDLSVTRNATVTGTLTAGAITTGGGNLTVGGNVGVTGVLTAGRVAAGGYDAGAGWGISGNKIISQEFVYTRASSSYRCWDNADFTYGVGIAASTLVQRDGSGQIQANAVYMPTANQSGKPTSVLGQSGDGYTRWWPTNAIGPPISAWYTIANMTLPALSGGGGTGNATFSAVANNGGFVVSGTTITVPRPGWYSVAGGFNGSNNTGNSETMNVQLIGSAHGVLDSLGVPIKISSFLGGFFAWEGYLDQGETIRLQFQTSFDAISGSGEILVSFVPIAQYNN